VPDAQVEERLVEAEHLVEAHSGELKKSLRLIDLVLSQVLYIVGIQWLRTAGKLGFSRLHPRFKTPVGSIICVAAATFIVTFVGNFGVGAQEAFQFLNNAGLICWALTYLVMFAIPLAGRGEHPPMLIRVAAASGFVMTLAYAVLSIFPVVEVKHPLSFTLRAVCLIVGLNAAGAWYFKSASRRRHAPAGL
jgi:amino acid transporter